VLMFSQAQEVFQKVLVGPGQSRAEDQGLSGIRALLLLVNSLTTIQCSRQFPSLAKIR